MPSESNITIEAIISTESGTDTRVRSAGWGTEIYIKPLGGLDGDGEIVIELQALLDVAKSLGIKLDTDDL